MKNLSVSSSSPCRTSQKDRSGHLALVACLMPLVGGCGLEGLIVDALQPEPEVIVVAPGTLTVDVVDGVLGPQVITLHDLFGNVLLEAPGAAGTTTLNIPSEIAIGTVRLSVQAGNKVLKAFVFCLRPEDLEFPQQVEVGIRSTAASLSLEALGTYRGYSDLWGTSAEDPTTLPALNPYALPAYASDELQAGYEQFLSEADLGEGPARTFLNSVERVILAGSEQSDGAAMFAPVAGDGALLAEEFLADTPVDYDGDGSVDLDPAAFNAAASQAAGALRPMILEAVPAPPYETPEGGTTAADGTPYSLIRVIFSAHVAVGIQDGNCKPIDICQTKTITCRDGDRLFFTGGIHKESPIQDSDIHSLLGGFIPNLDQMAMSDDGITGGDEVAGDQVYTITFMLPVGLRIGYKYTWGQSGETWTGTEEWPGNQRLLEIVDVNGDGYVWRDDNVTDEATNKDRSNCYQLQCDKTVTWTTDLNGDGNLEAREHPLALADREAESPTVTLNGECQFDAWVQPSRSARATANACML